MARSTAPESRPSAVKALTCPKARTADGPASRSCRAPRRGRRRSARWMITAITKNRTSIAGSDRPCCGGPARSESQVLLLEDAVEFVGDRAFHLLRDQVQAGSQAVAGAQGPADQLDRLGHGGDELLDPLAPASQQPEERQRAHEEGCERGSRRSGGGTRRRPGPPGRARRPGTRTG